MAVAVVFETHSWSEDNESGNATGWNHGRLSPKGRLLAAELGERRRDDGGQVLVVGHVATRWGIQAKLEGASLSELASTDFDWQLGWEYEAAEHHFDGGRFDQ